MADTHSTSAATSQHNPVQPVGTTVITSGHTRHDRDDRPLDRVRWSAVLAGLFGTLSVLAVLTVLGVAVGASTMDANSQAENYGLGAGIWGGISVLIAFAFGGWLAARTAAVGGGHNGLLQGACVWMVTLALLIYIVAGGVGMVARTATSVAQSAASNPQLTSEAQQQVTQSDNPTAQLRQQAEQLTNNITGRDVEQSADAAAKSSWGTLIAMLLALVAAAAGGYLGARDEDHLRRDRAGNPGH